MNDEQQQHDEQKPDEAPEVLEAGPAESLQAALKSLREEADAVSGMKIEDRVEAAEAVVEHAAELDKELGELARGPVNDEG